MSRHIIRDAWRHLTAMTPARIALGDPRARIHRFIMPDRSIVPGVIQVIAAVGDVWVVARIEAQAARGHIIIILRAVHALDLFGRDQGARADDDGQVDGRRLRWAGRLGRGAPAS